MTEALPVEITAVAARQIREADAWWRVNRTSAPEAIHQELRRAFSLLASQPQIGGRATSMKLPGVRRIYLPRVKYHVYYHVVDEPERIQIVAFWHARRGETPPI